jgi:hypothetical protein
MVFVSITRLRVHLWRTLPAFFIQTLRSAWQAKDAPGSISVSLLWDAHNTFWTRTLWVDERAMKTYIISGVHKQSMRSLLEWCDEAALVHWSQDTSQPPTWPEAHQRIQQEGRTSKVNHPSKAHVAYQIPQPQVRGRRELRFK